MLEDFRGSQTRMLTELITRVVAPPHAAKVNTG